MLRVADVRGRGDRILAVDIPIVFLVVPDPVRNGIIANQARPEGNLTGFATFEVSMGAKWYEVLREVAPDVARVGLLFNPTATGRARRYLSAIEDVARPFGTELENLAVHNEAEIETAVRANAFKPNASTGL